MTYANDNYEYVTNDGILEGFTIFDAAELYKSAEYSDEYNALYNEGWVITEVDNELEFATESGIYYMNFNKAQVIMIANS